MDDSQVPLPAPRTPLALRLDDVELLDTILSVGVFGELREAIWLGTPCVARKLPEGEKREDQMKNCLLWNSLNHPNIVMLMGVSISPGVDSWVVTELLTVNLANLLKNSPHSLLPLPSKLSILHDVALAVRYLHSMTPHPLLHGDLQAEHVFLTPSVRAKLDLWDTFFASDLEVRKASTEGFLNVDLEVTFHLSPEVLVEGYSSVKQSGKSSSDAFSFGVLCLHVLVQRLPVPKDAMILVSSDKAIFFSEQERRSRYLNALQGKEKLLLPIITQCLEPVASQRPSMAAVCDRLSQLQTQIGVGKQGESVLNGGTVVDISNHLQHISKSVDTTASELEAFQGQLRSLLGLADDAIVPVPNTPTLPRMAKKKMFDLGNSALLGRLKTLPDHFRHVSNVPTFASSEPEIDKKVDSPSKVRLCACGTLMLSAHETLTLHIYLSVVMLDLFAMFAQMCP